MSIQIGVNFEYKGELSNFARDSFETLRDMRNILDTDIDEGHISYCIETGKHYVFNKNNTIDVETGRWRLLTENPEDLKSALNLKADKSELNTKVDKVEGKSLISNTEIERLKNVTNYDDTDVKTDIADIKTSLDNKLESTDLDDINAHVSNTSIHITADERIKWDAKVDDSDLVGYEKTSDVNTKLNNKANKTDLNTHTGNTNIHVTANDKQKWNNKLDNTALNGYATESFVTTKIAEAATSGKVDLTGYATTIEVNNKLASKADKTEIPDISNLATKDELSTHADNSSIHITASEKTAWNNKLDASALGAYTTTHDLNSALALKANKDELFSGDYNDLQNLPVIPDTSNLATKGQLDGHINNATIHVTTNDKNNWNAKLDSADLTVHTNNTDIHVTTNDKKKWNAKLDSTALNGYATETFVTEKITEAATSGRVDLTGYAKTAEVDAKLDTKVDKVDGKGLSTNDYTTEEKTKVGKIKTDGTGTSFLANDGTYKKVNSSATAVAGRKFKPVFGFDTYWGEMRDAQGNKNQVDLATIKRQIDECEEMKVDRIICTVHIGWNERTNSLVIAENTDSILSAISYCNGKNVTIDTAKVHVHFKGTTTSEKDYINDTIGMSTFQTKYKAMLNTICNLFKGTTVTRIIILNEMWYITNANYGYSSFVNECLNIVKNAGYATGLSMAGFNSNQNLPDAVIKNLDTFYINVYPGISGFGKYMTKQEAIEAFEQCDVDLWIEKVKKQYPDKKIVISEMGVDDYWENFAAPSTWYINGASKTGGHAVDTYITAMMEFFINKNVDIEELWWWYNLYYEPVKETLLNYLGGDR